MASPESSLNLRGAPAASGKNPLEKLAVGPFEAAESPIFSRMMLEASTPVETPADTSQELSVEEVAAGGGKGLPGQQADRPPTARLRLVPAADRKLEEFAVGMGIDRGLARLLLIETAPEMTLDTVADAEAGADPGAERSANTPDVVISTPVAPLWIASATRTEARAIAAVEVVHDDRIVGTVPQRVVTAAMSPIADEDLLLWRSGWSSTTTAGAAAEAAATAETTPASDPRAEVLRAERPVAMEAVPAVASTADRLRARSAAALPSEAVLDVFAPDAPTIVTEVIPKFGVTEPIPVSDLRPDGIERPKRRVGPSLTDAGAIPLRDLSIASAGANGGESLLGSRQHDATPAPLAVSSMSTLAGVTPMPVVVDAPAERPTSAATTLDEASAVLSTPDPKLSFGERVQAFADAVAQRVLGQIRDDNWSVRLQLEPADLGAMDIDLTLRGNAVAATVGVANGEVRALLESGLPRLRENLESAGLQLAGWSFGQSGSRAFGEPAQKMLTQTAIRARPGDIDPVAELGASRLKPVIDNGSGAVDLFV